MCHFCYPQSYELEECAKQLFVTVDRKTDHFSQKLKFKLLLLVDTSILTECNGSNEQFWQNTALRKTRFSLDNY